MNWLKNFFDLIKNLSEEALKVIVSGIKSITRTAANLLHHLLDTFERIVRRKGDVPQPLDYREFENAISNNLEIQRSTVMMTDDELNTMLDAIGNGIKRARNQGEVAIKSNDPQKQIMQPTGIYSNQTGFFRQQPNDEDSMSSDESRQLQNTRMNFS